MELPENPKNVEDVDTDAEDHIYDAFRYWAMSYPVKPKKRQEIPKGSFTWNRNKFLKAKKYAVQHGTSVNVAWHRVKA